MQTNQILAILDGLNEISSFRSIMTVWNMAGIFKSRRPNIATANEIFKQDHIVDMSRNFKIRNAQIEKEIIHRRQSRLRKYEVLKSDENYPKRKELKLSTPKDLSMKILTDEEANTFRAKYSIRRFVHAYEEPKNHLITEYSLKLQTNEKPNKVYRKRNPLQSKKIAVLKIPPYA